MMDREVDTAVQEEELHLAHALASAEHGPLGPASGDASCLWCDDPVDPGREFCDAQCHRAWRASRSAHLEDRVSDD